MRKNKERKEKKKRKRKEEEEKEKVKRKHSPSTTLAVYVAVHSAQRHINIHFDALTYIFCSDFIFSFNPFFSQAMFHSGTLSEKIYYTHTIMHAYRHIRNNFHKPVKMFTLTMYNFTSTKYSHDYSNTHSCTHPLTCSQSVQYTHSNF